MKLFIYSLQANTELSYYSKRYGGTTINGDLSPTALDQLQVFGNDILFVKGDTAYMYYVANGQGDGSTDIDMGFLATKDLTLGGINDGWIRYSDGSSGTDATPVIREGASGQWDSQQILPKAAMYDSDDNLYKIWYMGTVPGVPYRIGYATSVDGYNFTKHPSNPIYEDPYTDPSGNQGWALYKEGVGVYHCIASGNRDVDTRGAFHLTSSDGINWVKNPTLLLVGTGIRKVSSLTKIGNEYIITTEEGFNPMLSVRIGGVPIIQGLWKSSDLVNFTKLGNTVEKIEPQEAGIAGNNFIEYNGKYYYSFAYFKNQWKAANFNDGNYEGFTALKFVESNVSPLVEMPANSIVYPDYVLKYYPLYQDPETNTPMERIEGDIPTTTGTLVWTDRRYVQFDTSQRIVYPSYENTLSEFSVKLNISPNLEDGNRLAVQQQNSWDISLNGGKLRVRLYDSVGVLKKDYETVDDVAIPPGVWDSGTEVKVGFTFNFGVLKLAFGAGVDKAVTKTVDEPLTEIILKNNVEVGANNHLALRSLVFMTNPTEYEWLYEIDL